MKYAQHDATKVVIEIDGTQITVDAPINYDKERPYIQRDGHGRFKEHFWNSETKISFLVGIITVLLGFIVWLIWTVSTPIYP